MVWAKWPRREKRRHKEIAMSAKVGAAAPVEIPIL
jgi:hypothetical protein